MENNTVAPTDYDTLRERLLSGHTHGNQSWPELCQEAAEAITQLQAKVERLEGALDIVLNDDEGDLDFVRFRIRRALSDKIGG